MNFDFWYITTRLTYVSLGSNLMTLIEVVNENEAKLSYPSYLWIEMVRLPPLNLNSYAVMKI